MTWDQVEIYHFLIQFQIYILEKYNGTIEFWDLDDSFEVSAILYGILSEVEL